MLAAVSNLTTPAALNLWSLQLRQGTHVEAWGAGSSLFSWLAGCPKLGGAEEAACAAGKPAAAVPPRSFAHGIASRQHFRAACTLKHTSKWPKACPGQCQP